MMIIRDHLVRHPDRCIVSGRMYARVSDRGMAVNAPVQIRLIPLFGVLPPMSRCLSISSHLLRVSQGRENPLASKEVRSRQVNGATDTAGRTDDSSTCKWRIPFRRILS